MTPDPLDLDAIEAKWNATTEGPWWLHVEEFRVVGMREPSRTLEIRYGDPDDDRDSYDLLDRYSEADYRAIAEAKQDVPALIARVRELKTELATAKVAHEEAGVLDAIREFIPHDNA